MRESNTHGSGLDTGSNEGRIAGQVHQEPELNCCVHFSENHRTRPARNEAQVEKAEVLLRHQIARLKKSNRTGRSPRKAEVKITIRKCETCGNIHTSFPIAGTMPGSRSGSRDRNKEKPKNSSEDKTVKNRWPHDWKKAQHQGRDRRVEAPERSSSSRKRRSPARYVSRSPPRKRSRSPERARPASKHVPVLPPGVETPSVVPNSVTVPSTGASRTIIVASCTPPPAETGARSTIKTRYKFGGLFAEAEFISGVPIKRVAQAKRYHKISCNFVGSRSNFEYDPQDGRSRAEVARARESDETRQQWRMRMFGGGGMPVDAIMMICHPTMYQSMIEDNPNYFEAAIAEQDQCRAFGAWLKMSRALQVTHRADDSMLPDPIMWEQVRANNPAGVGITMPGGRFLPETVAKRVNDYTGLVCVSEAMVDKLG
jgi:hypothetical protein